MENKQSIEEVDELTAALVAHGIGVHAGTGNTLHPVPLDKLRQVIAYYTRDLRTVPRDPQEQEHPDAEIHRAAWTAIRLAQRLNKTLEIEHFPAIVSDIEKDRYVVIVRPEGQEGG